MPNYVYDIIEAPVNLALDLAEVKLFLKIDDTSEDSLLTMLIKAASNEFENFTNRILITTKFRTYRDNFCQFELRKGNFQELTLMEYFSNDAWNTYDYVNNLAEIQRAPYAQFKEKDDVAANIVLDEPSQVKIEFTAGYGDDSTDIPAEIQLILMELVLFLYANRGDCADEDYPNFLKSKMDRYKLRSISAQM